MGFLRVSYESDHHMATRLQIQAFHLSHGNCRGIDDDLNKNGILSEHRRYASLTHMMKPLCHSGINLTENNISTKRNRARHEHGASLCFRNYHTAV